MDITSQEKVNISYVFISAYENIVDLIKPIHNALNDILKGSNSVNNEFIISMHKKFNEKYNSKTLKMKYTHRLLVEIGLMTKQELEILIKLSKIRNDIGHESLNIFFNESITYDYFKLEELIKLYKSLLTKFKDCFIGKIRNNELLNFNLLDCKYAYLKNMVEILLSNSKFNTIKQHFKNE